MMLASACLEAALMPAENSRSSSNLWNVSMEASSSWAAAAIVINHCSAQDILVKKGRRKKNLQLFQNYKSNKSQLPSAFFFNSLGKTKPIRKLIRMALGIEYKLEIQWHFLARSLQVSVILLQSDLSTCHLKQGFEPQIWFSIPSWTSNMYR